MSKADVGHMVVEVEPASNQFKPFNQANERWITYSFPDDTNTINQ